MTDRYKLVHFYSPTSTIGNCSTESKIHMKPKVFIAIPSTLQPLRSYTPNSRDCERRSEKRAFLRVRLTAVNPLTMSLARLDQQRWREKGQEKELNRDPAIFMDSMYPHFGSAPLQWLLKVRS